MSDIDLLLITPTESIAPGGALQVYETPYGAVPMRLDLLGTQRIARVASSESPFAAIYAAKAAGAVRVVELAPVAAINRLLEQGDLLLPDDMLDLTRCPRYTFYAGMGYGFLSQREPFCPTLRSALFAAARARLPRSFARGIYLAVEGPPRNAPASPWEADVAGDAVVPGSFLARELELCYAPLCVVTSREAGQPDGHIVDQAGDLLAAVLADALPRLPAERACVCATAMQQYRDRGDIGPDWRTWVA